MTSKTLKSLALAAVCITGTAAGYGQSAVDGAIGGTVEDSTGAVIPGAKVVIRNNGTNAEQTVAADASGFFRAIHLQPGLYTVTVAASGFGGYKQDTVEVTVGTLTNVLPHLTAGANTETVEVTTLAPAINTTNNDFSNNIDLKILEDLPVNNYRWSAYALLTPGVVEGGGFGLLSFRGQSTLLNNITFDGADDNQAFFSEERGRTRVGYSTAKASIEEFQVNTSNYSVEYGRSAGGVVNAVTKSGGNAFHGEAYFFDRDAEFGASNPFTTRSVQVSNTPPTFQQQVFKPKDWRKQTGIGIGGPIIKDKVFFFFAFDKFLRNFPGVSAPSSGAIFYAPVPMTPAGTNGTCAGTSAAGSGSGATAIAASTSGAVCQLAANLNGTPTVNATTGQAGTTPLALALVSQTQYNDAYTRYTNGVVSLNTMFGLTPRTGDQDIFFPKIDWQINSRNHATFELNRLRWTSPAGIQTGSSALSYGVASFGNDYVKDTFLIGKLDTLVTAKLSNEIRYQYGRDFEYEYNQTPTPYEQSTLLNPAGYTNPFQVPPLVTISNVFGSGFGTATFLNRAAYPDERRYQVSDTINLVRGNHNLKFGGDFVHTYDLSKNLTAIFGSYAYSGNNYAALTSYFTDQAKNNACNGIQCYAGYQQGFGTLQFDFTTQDYAGFAQDEWKVSPRLSLTLGIRYEYEQTPSPQIPNRNESVLGFVNGSTNALPDNRTNFGPRVGFAFDVFGDGKTAVRGGYGEFFGRLENSTIYNAIAQTGNPAGQFVTGSTSTNSAQYFGARNVNGVATSQFGPTFPQVINPTGFSPSAISPLPGVPSAVSVFYFDRNFKMPEIQQADLTVEQDIGYKTTLGLTWLYAGGRRLPDFVDTNLPASTDTVNYTVVDASGAGPARAGSVISVPFYRGPRPDARYQATTDIFSGVNTSYHALVVQLKHQTTRNLSFSANYTWSHALDYGENDTTFTATNLLFDPHNLRADYGNSNHNIPNRIVAYAVYNTPSTHHGVLGYLLNNYEIAPSFSGQSGNPYSAGASVAGGQPLTRVNTAGVLVTSASTSNGINGSGGALRLPGSDRNIFRYKRDLLVDLRVSKRFRIMDRVDAEILVESFNLANHLNVTSVSSTSAYTVGAGTATTPNTLSFNSQFGLFNPQNFSGNANSNFIYTPRQVQLGGRIQF